MPENLPSDETGLLAEARNFNKEAETNPTGIGLTTTQVSALAAQINQADAAKTAVGDARTALSAAVADKNFKFKALETEFRRQRQIAQAHPATTDVDRARLHLATGEGTGAGRVGMDEAPNLRVETTGVHAHRIRFYMAGEATDSTKKPPAALGCQIYLKIDGAATTDLKDYRMITLDTKSPYEYTHEAADAGKTAHYVAVWVDRDDARSPQSEVFSIVVT